MEETRIIVEPVQMHPPPSGTEPTPWLLFAGIFVAASFGGLASLLRSKRQITTRLVVSAMLNSGLFGWVIAGGMWRQYGGENPTLIFAISILAGLGGTTMIDFALQWLRARFGMPSLMTETK
jgi:hypothetical protein